MKIQTKLDICDEAWFMYENKARSAQVHEISISVKLNFYGITYVNVKYLLFASGWMDESKLYTTKAELIASL